MKNLIQYAAMLFMAVAIPASAQTVDEIVDNYIENIGGQEALDNIQNITYVGSVNQGGMEIPVKMIQTRDGKTALIISLQGQEITQYAYNGETMWATNFMTMMPEEKAEEDTQNMSLNANDFIDPIIGYKEKGYTVEYIGTETMEGAETYKVKLVTEPETIDGEQVESVSYYYFDTEYYIPIVTETVITEGPAKGQMATTGASDFDEVAGVMFPFSMNMQGQEIKFSEILVNQEIDDAIFDMPTKQ